MSLLNAAALGDIEDVARLLAPGSSARADVNFKDTDSGFTALHHAAFMGHVEVARLLLAQGADLDATTNDGDTALTLAAMRGDREMVALLLRAGAEATHRGSRGKTAAELAIAPPDQAEQDALQMSWGLSSFKNAIAGKKSQSPKVSLAPSSRKPSEVEGAEIDVGDDDDDEGESAEVKQLLDPVTESKHEKTSAPLVKSTDKLKDAFSAAIKADEIEMEKAYAKNESTLEAVRALDALYKTELQGKDLKIEELTLTIRKLEKELKTTKRKSERISGAAAGTLLPAAAIAVPAQVSTPVPAPQKAPSEPVIESGGEKVLSEPLLSFSKLDRQSISQDPNNSNLDAKEVKRLLWANLAGVAVIIAILWFR